MVCDNRFPVSHLIETFVWWLEQSWDLFALSQHATACDNKLQVAVRNDMRLFLRTTKSSTPYWKSTNPVPLQYYKILLQYYSVIQSTTPVLVCTTKYLHTWNVIYNARSNKSQPPTSASTAPATKNGSHDQSSSHMKRCLQCAE